MATPFSNKCRILGDLWIFFKEDEDFSEFIQYNDLGLPLAYFLAEGMVTVTDEKINDFVNETWDLFAQGLGLDENHEYTSLEEIELALEARDKQ